MKKKLQLVALSLLATPLSYAQNTTSTDTEKEIKQDNATFVFTESQLGENEDDATEVIQVNSATNVYTSQIGYTWGGSMRFKFRALDSKYNETYMNGVSANNAELGWFNYSTIGGMNDATNRSRDAVSPFESNNYSISGIGGSTNYNFRASSMASGHKVTLSGANRNYTTRAMYTYGTGLTSKGWAFFGTVGYRWANMNTANVKGTFYNSLAYFLTLQKIINEKHSLNLATWGNPSERATQGPAVDEARWLANDYQYNPYWGYQNGKKRSSRIVKNYEPTALLTWDFKIKDNLKMTTSGLFRYIMKNTSSLSYNDAQNPAADYWKNFPSAKFNPWGTNDAQNWEYSYQDYWDTYNYWQTEANRQIKWDELYAKNTGRNAAGEDAAYYLVLRHQDYLTANLASTFNWNISENKKLNWGIQLGSTKGMHYQTIGDMMGANSLHNVNSYALGKFSENDPEYQYDLNNPNQSVGKGDKFGYNYDIMVQNFKLWSSYTMDKGISHSFIAAKIGGTQMWRNGHMRNGIYADHSYGKSGKAYFLDGGFKLGSNLNLGKGNVITFGAGYEANAPKAAKSFMAPEMNNNFIGGLKVEKNVSAELGYALTTNWLRLNLTGFFYHMYDLTEYSQYFDDEKNSFTYNNLTGVAKNYYGVELGARFKVTSNLDVVALGTISDAKYTNNSFYNYTLSTPQVISTEKEDNNVTCYSKGMREGGSPLTAVSLGLNYRVKRWFLNLTGNYFDRIYLGFAPNQRTADQVEKQANDPITGEPTTYTQVPPQAKGKGGFMLDASIGRMLSVAHHPLFVNLQLCNILNNRSITTGGFEQSRKNYSQLSNGNQGNLRVYDFSKNPRKFYAQGFNFMLNLNYRF